METWRGLPVAQQPPWPDQTALRAVTVELAKAPPLVDVGECGTLKERLASAARGQAFVLQGGDCAETFTGSTAGAISAKLRTLLRMAVILTYGASLPVVQIGRIAGQFAKPRSSDTEIRGGLVMPVYRGDAVNGLEFTAEARTPDPARLLRACRCSAATLKLCRAITRGGYAEFGTAEFYSSHEALLLDYENALTRFDSRSGRPYDSSAHFVWVGERTRGADGAHIEFARQISNPIGVKLGPSATPEDALTLIELLDPRREPGRLTFITRMGAALVRDVLPPLVEKVAGSGAQVVWVCDPMHGNTIETADGHKTRRMADIVTEVTGFFEVHRALGTQPGGIHIEFTGEDVTECTGGSHGLTEADLTHRYETACDPRLNRSQSLDLALRVAELCRG